MMNVDRFGQWAFEAIPLDALKLSWPRLAAIQAEVSHLIAEHAQAAREVTALEASREGAREQDLDAAAAAIRAGSGAPAPKAEPKLERKLEGAIRTRDAFARAVSSAIGDSNAFRLKHAASLEADAVNAVEALRSKLADKARQTAALYAESEAAAASVKKLAVPAPPPPESTAAGRDTSYFPEFVATASHRSAGPARGDIERVLNYLAAGA
jgi:hypothetical protein